MEQIMTEVFRALPAIGGAALISILTSWVTVRLSIRQFRLERQWEKRAQSTERIFDALHQWKRISEIHLQAFEDDRAIEAAELDDLIARWKDARAELLRAVDVGHVYLSSDAMSVLEDMESDLYQAENPHEPFFDDALNARKTFAERYLERFAPVARADLNL